MRWLLVLNSKKFSSALTARVHFTNPRKWEMRYAPAQSKQVSDQQASEHFMDKPKILRTDMYEFDIRFGHANYLIGKYISPDTRKGRFLDIGCGAGNGVVAALPHGASLGVGVDIAFDTFGTIFDVSEFSEICKAYNASSDRALLVETDIFLTRFPHAAFDYVVFIDSFEHVPEPRKFIELAFRLLKPGGFLLLATAPLYYSKRGHHLWGEGVYPGGIPPWGHLFSGFDDAVLTVGVDPWHLKHHLALNRATYAQGITFIQEAGFDIEYEESFPVSEADRKAYEQMKHKIVLPKHVEPEELFREQIVVRAKKPDPLSVKELAIHLKKHKPVKKIVTVNTIVLVIKLAWADFVNRHRRSYMGSLWSVIYPLTTVFVLWFIFTQAFKAQPDKDGHPFIVWLLAGMAAWHFFAEALTTATQAVTGNAFLLKKRSFNLFLLPCVRVATAFFSHMAFMILVGILYLFYEISPSLHWLQLPYYIACAMLLTTGLGLITSSISVFVPDLDHVVAVFIQLFFWVTPVFWSISMVPPQFGDFLALNPVAYLVQGYRDALLGQGWLWDRPMELAVFWGIAISALLVGNILFNRLKPHFADVL